MMIDQMKNDMRPATSCHCEGSQRMDCPKQSLRSPRPCGARDDGERLLKSRRASFGRGLTIALAISGSILLAAIPSAKAADSLEKAVGRIPVQAGGRTKPFASFAKESVLFVTGKTSFAGEDPTTLVWRWIAQPEIWSAKPILPVTHLELRKYFESDLVRNRISPVLVLNDLEFKKIVNEAQIKESQEKRISQLEKKQIELYHRARLFEETAHGRMPGFVPHPGDPKISWLPLEALLSREGLEIAQNLYPKSELEQTASSLALLLDHLRGGDFGQSYLAGERFAQSIEHVLLSRDIFLDQNAMNLEFLYLKLRPFQLAWILYLLSIIIWLAPNRQKKVTWVALALFVAGFAVHSFGFVLRMLIAGRPPVTNMYESIVWVSWGAAFFSLLFWIFFRSNLLPAVAACVATLTLIIAESCPTFLDSSISPLSPVLRSNYWLTIHVLTITLGYGAFLLNWGIAHALLYCLAFRKKRELVEHLTQYLYRSLQVGVILLASGTILGGVWAAESWGRFWGWDPKETWALIAVLAYLAVLHSRTAGWLDAFGVAFWSAVSFLTVLMAWYGVNFVLGAGLHSYGFGGGGLPYVLAFVVTDILAIVWLARRFKTVSPHH